MSHRNREAVSQWSWLTSLPKYWGRGPVIACPLEPPLFSSRSCLQSPGGDIPAGFPCSRLPYALSLDLHSSPSRQVTPGEGLPSLQEAETEAQGNTKARLRTEALLLRGASASFQFIFTSPTFSQSDVFDVKLFPLA